MEEPFMEIELLNRIREFITPGSFLDKLFEFITFFGEQYILIIVMIMVYFAYSKKVGQRMAFAIFGSLLINNAVKAIIRRPRPFENPNCEYTPTRPETATGYSFPSGHTQNAAVTYTSLSMILKKKRYWVITGIMVLLIAVSRMFLGVHYLTDVLTGAVLGIASSFLGFWLHKKFESNFGKQIGLYLAMAVFFLPLLFIFWDDVHEDYNKFRDFYISYSFYLGFIAATAAEHRLMDFDCSQPFRIRIIRAFGALIVAGGTLFGLDKLFSEQNVIFDMIRYFCVAFTTLAIYPLIFRKLLFRNAKK
jgi:membrane-associated phospholipid phosphatase